MELETWTTLLVAIAPAFAAICTIVGGFLGFVHKLKQNNLKQEEKLEQALSKLNNAYKDIATMKAQLSSINQFLLDKKERRR